jgi:hypothetical protein
LENLQQSLAITALRRQRIRHVRKDMPHVVSGIGIAALAATGALIAKGKVRAGVLARHSQ